MNAKRVLQDLENKDMDRKAFLKYSGLFVLGIVSTKTALGAFLPATERHPASAKTQQTGRRGFGRSKYGV